jgi:hypothetical protein
MARPVTRRPARPDLASARARRSASAPGLMPAPAQAVTVIQGVPASSSARVPTPGSGPGRFRSGQPAGLVFLPPTAACCRAPTAACCPAPTAACCPAPNAFPACPSSPPGPGRTGARARRTPSRPTPCARTRPCGASLARSRACRRRAGRREPAQGPVRSLVCRDVAGAGVAAQTVARLPRRHPTSGSPTSPARTSLPGGAARRRAAGCRRASHGAGPERSGSRRPGAARRGRPDPVPGRAVAGCG